MSTGRASKLRTVNLPTYYSRPRIKHLLYYMFIVIMLYVTIHLGMTIQRFS